MGMGDQNQIDGGQISHFQSRMTKPFQYEQPAGEIRVNDNIQSAHLHEKAGMANKSYAKFMTCNQLWFVGLASSRRHCGVAYQPSKLAGALVKSTITQGEF